MLAFWGKVSISQSILSSKYVSRLCSATFYRQSAVNKSICRKLHSSSSSSDNEFLDRDKPIKFSTSDAYKHRAYDTFCRESKAPWYQPYVVSGSIAVFLLYFCVFREENDIDERMGKTIWEKVPPLRDQVLEHKIREGTQLGTDVSELEKESREIRRKYK